MSTRRFYDYTLTQAATVTSCAVDVPDDDELVQQGFLTPETRDARRLEIVRETLEENIHFVYSVAKTWPSTRTITDVKEGHDWRKGVSP